jgi:hypothetical protein
MPAGARRNDRDYLRRYEHPNERRQLSLEMAGRGLPQQDGWDGPEVMSAGQPDQTDDVAGRPERHGRRRADIILFLFVGASAVVGVLVANGRGSQGTGNAGSAPPVAAVQTSVPATPQPLLVAPVSVLPGDVATLLIYRRSGPCGDTELFLDGAPLAYHIVTVIDTGLLGWDAVLVSVQIPATTTRSTHQLSLVGPVPGPGPGQTLCGGQHLGTTAVVSLVVGASTT